jgi:hypothetical protein
MRTCGSKSHGFIGGPLKRLFRRWETRLETTDPILETKGVIKQWLFRVRRMQFAHYDAARRYSSYRLWLGIPVIVLGAAVGATIQISTEKWLQVILGLLSIASAALAGLQTFLNYAELSEQHRISGARFASLKHRIELLGVKPSPNEKQLVDELAKLEKHWAKIREDSPNVPNRIWRHIEAKMTFQKFEEDYARMLQSTLVTPANS